MSTVTTRLRRFAHRLGPVTLILMTGGGLGLGVSLIAALIGHTTLAQVGISAGLLFLLLLLTEQRLRQTHHPAATGTSPAPAVQLRECEAVSIQIQDMMERQIEDLRTSLEVRTRNQHRRLLRDTYQQHAALMQLLSRHTPADPVLFSDQDPAPDQILRLVHLVDQRSPDRILAIDTGAATTWLAASTPGKHTSLEVLTDRDSMAAVATAGATARTAPTYVPPVPHALLPWYDLTDIGSDYDLIVINATGIRMRPVLPVLPMLTGHLSEGGQVVALEDDARLGAAWSAHPEWIVEVGPGVVIARVADATEVDLGTLSGRD